MLALSLSILRRSTHPQCLCQSQYFPSAHVPAPLSLPNCIQRSGLFIFFPHSSVSLSLCPVYNKVHSAVAVCKANTDLNHFSILITSAAETITPAFALSSLFASVPSPKPIYPLSAAIRYRRLPICTSSCFVIIFPLITHPTHILYLCLSLLLLSFFFPPPPAPIPVLIWVWPGHVCSVSCASRPI